ncbi:MAG: protein O-GlcNAcase [Gaiellaceae bacterium MAG52_C11]|nr:protein O-GlcNAcase [Candidatus Gaiellasilicea maunaloa]
MIEGFYGPPWSHAERLELIRFCGREGLNTWVHAPKGDPFHRKLWREPYPDAELEQLGELVRESERHGVELAYAIAPGLDICYSKDEELETLLAKCAQVQSAGVTRFQLLWDDIDHSLNCAEDETRYGTAERPSGAAQCDFSNRFLAAFPQPGPLVICPMGYAGTGDSPYRRSFGPDLHSEIVVYWTGPEVVSLGITREALNAAVARFHGHELLLWDNYPVNDFDAERPLLFLGPLVGRDARLAEGHCAGLIANAMVQAIPSKLALATIADWTREPAGYDPIASYERALREYGAEVVEAIRDLAAKPAPIEPPGDVRGLVAALELGVHSPTALALLEPFV